MVEESRTAIRVCKSSFELITVVSKTETGIERSVILRDRVIGHAAAHDPADRCSGLNRDRLRIKKVIPDRNRYNVATATVVRIVACTRISSATENYDCYESDQAGEELRSHG